MLKPTSFRVILYQVSDMPDYIVSVCRTAHSFRDFLVKGARNENEAMVTAENQAGNHLFTEKNSGYEVEGVIELEEGQSPGANLEVLIPGKHTKPTLK